jgi:hypothetical protein
MPWLIRLAIDIVAGIIVLGVGPGLVLVLPWLIRSILGLFGNQLSAFQEWRRCGEARRLTNHRKSLGHDE